MAGGFWHHAKIKLHGGTITSEQVAEALDDE